MQVETSTQNISRDVTAILNLLQPTKCHQNEQLSASKDSQVAAGNSLSVLRDAVAAASIQIQQASEPGPSVIAPPLATDQSLSVVKSKPVLGEYMLSAHDLSSKATIVLVSASNLCSGTSQTAEVPAATKDNGDHNSTSVGFEEPSEAIKLKSEITSQDSILTPQQSYVRVPASFKSQPAAVTRRPWTDNHVHSRAVRASSDQVTVSASNLVIGWKKCGLDDSYGRRKDVWRQPELLSSQEIPLPRCRSMMEHEEELLAAAGGMYTRQGSVSLGTEVATYGETPQPRRSSRGRWSGSLLRSGGSRARSSVLGWNLSSTSSLDVGPG